MNIFDEYLNKIKNIITDQNKKGLLNLPENLNSINVDIPPEHFDCDISTNVSMVLAKINSTKPVDLANRLSVLIKQNDTNIKNIDVAKPGFINIKFKQNFWNEFLKNIIINKNDYGRTKTSKKRYLVEFVSANPTGPLHVGHCRGAILGDVISNILKFNNHEVVKEYYVNDYGNQIISFTKSVYLRIREILYNEKFPLDNDDLYPGDYIIEIANNIINENSDLDFSNFESISSALTNLSIEQSLNFVKSNLDNLGIKHDNFVKETDIINKKEVDKVVKYLKNKNFVYEGKIEAPKSEKNSKWIERNQLLFRSTDFGDDKDRALQKSDKTWTYFAGDVAYHKNKLDRNFDVLINILGADHAGYIKRISSVVEALSGKKDKIKCKVSQLVKLIKEGKPFKMSKRKGDYITVEDLVNEVGKDATRFIMLNRSSDVELDFDFTKVKEKSKDNPLYYVQYCYARISSVFRNVNIDINNDINIKSFNFNYSPEEIKILKKISEWPKCLEVSAYKLEPHRIPVYLYELASEFHSYWNMGKENVNLRFIDKDNNVSDEKIIFLKVISKVIKTGMDIVGVNTPEKM
tara:strand:+ start:1746 stop:3476 length:1731 start_codon:yes stop_codon:yes gene_type:complete